MNKLDDFIRKLNRKDAYIRNIDYKIQISSSPMNDFYWIGAIDLFGDQYMRLNYFRYVEYSDPINNRLWPFKKD